MFEAYMIHFHYWNLTEYLFLSPCTGLSISQTSNNNMKQIVPSFYHDMYTLQNIYFMP